MIRNFLILCYFSISVIAQGQESSPKANSLICKGTGINPNCCYVCKGKGTIYQTFQEMCRACAGGNKHCPVCKGSGKYGTRRVKVVCPSCDGILTDKCPDCVGSGNVTIEKNDSLIGKCPSCKGKGTIEKQCSACSGIGNSSNVSEYRMKHDIDYWVCRACRGMKRIFAKCNDCKGTGTEEGFIERQKERTLQFLNIRFMCEPCVHSKIYEHIGFVGSGTLNGNIKFENGRFVNYSSRSSTQSNGWYDYHITIRNTDVSYSDSLAQMECTYSSYGAMTPNGSPASNWKREKQDIKNGTDKTASYKITCGKASSELAEIEYVNDSTIIEKYNGNSYYRKYIITTHHIQIITPSEEDMWNIEIWLSKGQPIRIKDYSGERQYKYIDFDNHNNWTKRDLVDNVGKTLRTITRTVTYND